MTEKLFDVDSHLTECRAVVRACAPAEGGFALLLDRTVLFPEGGGQPSDQGTVEDANVLFCRAEGDEVVHVVDRPLPVGAAVTVKLDWARRFDFMQQHTGEHLLSFAFYKLFSAANVGFHLAETYATIDFDKPLDEQQIAEAELLANRFVWRNLPVTATLYPDEDAVKDLPLRKHAEGLTAPIRIVSIEDADCCTCCAPHCGRTGEIGEIFVTDAAAYKGGARLTFCCGRRALLHSRRMHETVDALARRFSVSRDKAEEAVGKLSSDYAAARHGEKALTARLNEYLAVELAGEARAVGKRSVIVHLFEGMEPGRLKDLAQSASAPERLTALFSVNGGKLAYVLFAGERFDLPVSELIAAVNAATGGKGGGRDRLAQGMAGSAAGAKETVEQLRHYFLQRIK